MSNGAFEDMEEKFGRVWFSLQQPWRPTFFPSLAPFHPNHVIPDSYSWPAIFYAGTDMPTAVLLYLYLEI